MSGWVKIHRKIRDNWIWDKPEYLKAWLDLIFKKNLKLCVDWSRIDKKAYLTAMHASTTDAKYIKALLKPALTDQINDREIFMKGIDYSYYYEQEE